MFGIALGAPPWRQPQSQNETTLLEQLYDLHWIGEERNDPLCLEVFQQTHPPNVWLEDEIEHFAGKYGANCNVNDLITGFISGYRQYYGRGLVIWKELSLFYPPTQMSEDEMRNFLTERLQFHLCKQQQRLKRPRDAESLTENHHVSHVPPQNPFQSFGQAKEGDPRES